MTVVREPTTCTKKRPSISILVCTCTSIHNPQHTMIYIHANGNRFRQHECLTEH